MTQKRISERNIDLISNRVINTILKHKIRWTITNFKLYSSVCCTHLYVTPRLKGGKNQHKRQPQQEHFDEAFVHFNPYLIAQQLN